MKSIGTLILAAALAACGGTESAAAPYPWGGAVTVTAGTPGVDCVGATIVTVTYSATGVNPASVSVPVGGCIQWVNADAVPHWPQSFSHCTAPLHAQCAWLNSAPLAPNGQAGDRATVGPAPATAPACTFHDDANPPPCGGGGGGGY